MITQDGPAIDPELWQKITAIFADAADLPVEERDRFLRAAGEPSAVEREVRRLLNEHERPGDFLEAPAMLETGMAESAESSPVCREGDLLNARFQIVRLLGAGGMGEVYEAFDSELRQKVAIKTLRANYACDPAMVERFREEVLRSRQITHPNVARVYDLFTHRREDGAEVSFFTMELLEGEPLSHWLAECGLLTTDAALPLLEQMASALHAAHSVGIVHRDFKPGHVFISGGNRGVPKATVTDFGLAIEWGSVPEPESSAGAPVPSGGSLLAGTPAYMAPEQLLGNASTPAVDVYAFGLVAYEMLTGRRAFDAKSPLAYALRKTMDTDPQLFDANTGVPTRWVEAIHRMVRREPEERPANPLDFIAAIKVEPGVAEPAVQRSVSVATLSIAAVLTVVSASGLGYLAIHSSRDARPRLSSLAVLPFENSGGDSQSVYLTDGIAEGLTRSLTAFPKLHVAAPAAAAVYRDRKLSPQRIAQSLGVQMVMLGSLSQSGHRLHLSAELLDEPKGARVWTKIYDCDMEELLSVQADIVKQVASRLGLGAAQPKAARPPTANAEAYDLFLRGRYLWNTRKREGVTKSLEYFDRAVHLDPTFALAYTAIADANTVLVDYGWAPPIKVAPKIRDALQRSLALNADSAETQSSLGLFDALIEWDQTGAERAFQRALSLEPLLSTGHHWYSTYLIRAGRLDEALREALEARRLDPATMPTLLMVGHVHYFRREYAQAIDIAKQVIELSDSLPNPHQLLAMCYASLGEKEKAIQENAVAVRLTTDSAVALRERAWVLSRIADQAEPARKAAAELEAVSQDRQAGYLAIIYAGLRDREQMYRWADRAIELRDPALGLAAVDAALDPYRNEPRFRQFVRQMGFP